ncbi:MAG TPA: alkaline phosphatase family protein [Verrucomicrobiota bacterium]|nr:alkaline phosphatase family protein [Verrucomicrobiota bacterium]HRR65566.1 alkaline phosphatase family protein [Candidatus Paceibacterota bacterium]HOM46398.1 alkaline phosphatase family protein [Verrucomicrobiota bacterium]HOQ56746.1 alkaline phosphatase family protein [Verrucomicrobiota bacterium]HPC53938.1 alkaline phosphatase family protein [Verrucomicrobiota bacterium]
MRIIDIQPSGPPGFVSATAARLCRSAFLALLAGGLAGCEMAPPAEVSTRDHVGRVGANRYYNPANQVLTPAGLQIELPGMRPQALALSPNGKLLVTAGKTPELVVLDPGSGRILQRVPLPSEKELTPAPSTVSDHILQPDKEGQVSFTGLVFSPDGKRIYLANVNGSIKVFGEQDGRVRGLFSIPLPRGAAPRREAEIPAGLAVSRDGKRLYVALNLSNRLAELEADTGKILRLWEVGVAPYDVVLAGGKAYVSNWGGRRPDADSVTGPAGRGTLVRVDPVRFIASEGSVSVIDLAPGADPSGTGKSRLEILTGLHASAMALSPNGRLLVVANAGSDTLSVINTERDELVETFSARQNPGDLFGAQPNALAFDRSGKRLFACNGTQNAVAVFAFAPGNSRLLGLIPVGWFPSAVAPDPQRKKLYVANLKGVAATESLNAAKNTNHNSLQYRGTLSLVDIPSARELAAHTRVALANLRYPLLRQAARPPRPNQPPRPVPERVGEPSVFRHVVYIIKENRTYDQVLGDMPEGNGDPSLCIFGERITPNQHKLAREFVLLDNTYCSGLLSADGHQWADSAMATDYMERSFAGFPRSYPDGMDDNDIDALAYSPGGFIWDNAIAHGKTLRSYGEFAITEAGWADPARKGSPKFLDYYHDFINQTRLTRIRSRPGIESLRPYLATNTVGWSMEIPDIFRAAQFIGELKQFEAHGGFPNLSLICLPNNHTSGTRAGSPTPAAHVADNDLALGRIIEAISRSRFWPETCVFVIEDDPQAGWDHVSGYRTTAFVASPYTRRGVTVSTQYNQTSLLRTMELMLGLPPMNQLDATATPMSDCFTPTPDFTPFTAVPNNIPLDQMNSDPKQVSDPLLRKHAYASARLPLEQIDQCPEDLLNRILWHAMKGSQAPYPVWAVRLQDDDDD